MITVHAGMADGQGEGHGVSAVFFRIFPKGDDREKIGGAAVIHGTICRIIQPGGAGDAEEIHGLSFFYLDALLIFVCFCIIHQIMIESIKIVFILAPAVGKCFVIFMEDSEVGIQMNPEG